jgi:arylsulfatase A-like enzyme
MRTRSLWTVLSTALTAAFLNLATSVLDHPRALASLSGWLVTLSAGACVCCAVAVLLLAPFAARQTRPRSSEALELALGLTFVLAAALAPLVEVGMRDTNFERAAVVLVCAAGFLVSAGTLVYVLALRAGEVARSEVYLAAPPWAALVLSFALWTFEYHASSLSARAAVLALAGLALFVVVHSVRGRPVARVVRPLASAVPILGAVGFLGLPHAAPGEPSTSTRPPVVLVTVDTLRADRVLGDGPARVPTPNLDAFLADSVVFTHARAAAPWTKPSLATILSGVSPLVHGMTNRRARLPDSLETLAERLRTAGYHTGALGLNAHLERAFGFDQGFVDYAFPAREDYGIALGARLLERLSPARFPELFPSTTAISDAAVDWIAAHAGEPFFLWVHVLDPHWPYEPPAEWVEHPELEPRRWGEPEMVTNVQAGNTKPGEAERERVRALYAGEIRYVDAELARVFAALKEHGLYERALIAFASDHGEEFWEHGHYEHGHTLYDEVLRVPLAFKLPGAGARTHVDEFVSTESLTPTLLDVMGVPFDPATFTSGSLVPFWSSTEVAPDGALFATGTYYFGEKRAVLFDGWKLILEVDTQRVELYDLADDPHELHSVASAHPEVCAEGLRRIEERLASCARLRAKLGVRDAPAAEAGEETTRMLQGLGYGGAD